MGSSLTGLNHLLFLCTGESTQLSKVLLSLVCSYELVDSFDVRWFEGNIVLSLELQMIGDLVQRISTESAATTFGDKQSGIVIRPIPPILVGILRRQFDL